MNSGEIWISYKRWLALLEPIPSSDSFFYITAYSRYRLSKTKLYFDKKSYPGRRRQPFQPAWDLLSTFSQGLNPRRHCSKTTVLSAQTCAKIPICTQTLKLPFLLRRPPGFNLDEIPKKSKYLLTSVWIFFHTKMHVFLRKLELA